MTMRTRPSLALALLVLAGPAALQAGTTGALAQTAAAPAAPSAAPAPTPVPVPAAETVGGLAAWDRLKGNTIQGKAGADTFSEFFDPAGAVKFVDKDGASAGTWTVKGDKVCVDFPEDDDRSCVRFEVSGTTGTSRDDDGTLVRFDISLGNSKGL